MSESRKDRAAHSNALPRLGELELAVLAALWDSGAGTVQTVTDALPPAQRPGLNTVQSTLERLHRKQLVGRTRSGRAYRYHPRVSRAQLLGKLLGGVISQLHTGSLDPILSSFVDFADRMDAHTLDRLDVLVQQRKRRREERDD